MHFFGPNISSLLKQQDINGLLLALKHKRVSIRASAAIALGELGNPMAIEPLVDALSDVYEVERNARLALLELCDLRAVPFLLKLLENSSQSTKVVALGLLTELNAREAIDPLIDLLKEEKRGFLSRLFDDDDTCRMRVNAIRALSTFNDSKSIFPFLNSLKDDSHRDVRQAAEEALCKVEAPETIEPILSLLNSSDRHTQLAAAHILGETGGIQAIIPLFKVLVNERRYADSIPYKALSSLVENLPEGVAFIVCVLKGEDQNLLQKPSWFPGKTDFDWLERIIAKHLLESLGLDKSWLASDLFIALEGKKWTKQTKPDNILQDLKQSWNLDLLINNLKSKDTNIRVWSAWALGVLKITDSIAALTEGIQDRNWRVRLWVALAMGHIQSPQCTLSLVHLLKDKHWDVRRASALSLGKIKDPRAVEPLLNALNDEIDIVRETAEAALYKMKDFWTVESLIKKINAKNF